MTATDFKRMKRSVEMLGTFTYRHADGSEIEVTKHREGEYSVWVTSPAKPGCVPESSCVTTAHNLDEIKYLFEEEEK